MKNCRDKIIENMDRFPFANKRLKLHPRYRYPKYLRFQDKGLVFSQNAYMDIRRVVGSSHNDCAGKTWKEAFFSLKRPENANINCNGERPSKDYYTDREYREKSFYDRWSFDVINGGEVYITEGNNRTIVARFLCALGEIQPVQFGLSQVNYITHNTLQFHQFLRLAKLIEKHNLSKKIRIGVYNKEIPLIKTFASSCVFKKPIALERVDFKSPFQMRIYFIGYERIFELKNLGPYSAGERFEDFGKFREAVMNEIKQALKRKRTFVRTMRKLHYLLHYILPRKFSTSHRK